MKIFTYILIVACIFTNECIAQCNPGVLTPSSWVVCSTEPAVFNLIDNSSLNGLQWQTSTDGITWSNSGACCIPAWFYNITGLMYIRACTQPNGCPIVCASASVNTSSTPVITFTNITSNSVTVSWTPFGINQTLSWAGAGTGSLTPSTNPVTITGLTPCTNLTVTVIRNSPCPGTNTGTASATTSCCSLPPLISSVATCPNQISTTILGTPNPYQVELKKILPILSAPTIFTTSSTTPNFNIAQTTTGATYQLRARKVCGGGSYSPWSSTSTVVVQPACTPPTNLASSAVTNSGFNATWNPPSCSNTMQGYFFYRKPVTATFYSSFPVATTSHVSTGLQSNASYNYYVRGYYLCGGNAAWTQASPVQTVTTLMRLGEEDKADVMNSDLYVYPNPTSNVLYIELPDDIKNGLVVYEMFNALGQSFDANVTSDENGTNVMLLSDNLAEGLYWLRIRSGTDVWTKQIAVLR